MNNINTYYKKKNDSNGSIVTVKAIQFTRDYNSIKSCIKFTNPHIEDDTVTEKFAAVGRVLKDGFIKISHNENAFFGDYIIIYDDNKISAMSSSSFRANFSSMSDFILDERWHTITQMGGELYKEYILTSSPSNVFIVTNNKKNKYIVHANNNEDVFNISQISIPVLISMLKGYIPVHFPFSKPEYDITYKLTINSKFKDSEVGQVLNSNTSKGLLVDIDPLFHIDPSKLPVDYYINKLKGDWYDEYDYSKQIEKISI